MKFETHVAKFTDHEVYTNVESKLPTIRLYENNKYALSIALHKWKNESDDIKVKGEFIAVYKICDFEDKWESIDLTETYNLLQNTVDSIKSFDSKTLENGTYIDSNIIIYKFSVNVWRRVEYIGKKVKKWTFIDEKPNKEDQSKIQRLLYS
jgi:hypothetical protein